MTVRGKGRGGRNAEFALGLALALDGAPGVYALAGDTDGIDGSEDNAGAFLAPDFLARVPDARARLDSNDAYGAFEAAGGLVVTGPTLTNVNDFRAMLVTAGEAKGRSEAGLASNPPLLGLQAEAHSTQPSLV